MMLTLNSQPLIGLVFVITGYFLFLIGALFYILYQKIKKLFNPTYFYFDTCCSKYQRNNQIKKFSSILEGNIQRTLKILSNVHGMQHFFDFIYLDKLAKVFIEQNKIVLNKLIDNEEESYLETNINTYIEKFSQILCTSLNRTSNFKNINVRFFYTINNKNTYEGLFNVINVIKYSTSNKNMCIYEIINNNLKTMYYLINYEDTFHSFLSINLDEVNTIRTAVIDGTMRTYSKINFDDYDDIDDFYNPDVISLQNLVHNFCNL